MQKSNSKYVSDEKDNFKNGRDNKRNSLFFFTYMSVETSRRLVVTALKRIAPRLDVLQYQASNAMFRVSEKTNFAKRVSNEAIED